MNKTSMPNPPCDKCGASDWIDTTQPIDDHKFFQCKNCGREVELPAHWTGITDPRYMEVYIYSKKGRS